MSGDANRIGVIARNGPVDATVSVPGSKSVANRALVCALLADGVSTIESIPAGDDVDAMVAALAATGRAERIGGTVRVSGGVARGPLLEADVDCAIAGTTSRFLTAVAALCTRPVRLDGGEPLRRRPMADLHAALSGLGADVAAPSPGHLPVVVSRGSLRGGRVAVNGDASSQFVSSLMMIGPMLPDGVVIEIVGALVSRPYVEMTAEVMESFGADVRIEGSEITVAPRHYLPRTYAVEPDYSSAAFPLVGGLIAGGRVRIPGLALSRMQGDRRILEILRSMGAVVGVDRDDVVVVAEGRSAIRAIDVDMADCSDLVPAVAVAMGLADGPGRIRGVGFIRAKESDRLGDLAAELARAGIAARVDEDGLVFPGRAQVRAATFSTHHDHRLAMALSLVSLAGVDVVIDGADVVSKSWPAFFPAMEGLLHTEGSSK